MKTKVLLMLIAFLIGSVDVGVFGQTKPTTQKSKTVQKKDSFVGKYFCQRTHDSYVFKSDKTGYFVIQGGQPSNFTWKRSGNNIVIMYKYFGEQPLKYDPKTKTIIEKSESLGILVFNKQK